MIDYAVRKSMVVLAMGLTKCGSIYCGTCTIWLLGMHGYYTRNVVNVKIPRAMIICLSGMSSLHNLLGAIHHEKKVTSLNPNLKTTAIDNMGTHEYVHMNCKRPKCCVAHRQYQPNLKARKETIFGCYQCNSNFCRDCFRMAHLNLAHQLYN